MTGLVRLIGAFAVLAASAFTAGAAELLMVEQRGCIYCARWHADVGDAYDNTAEGRLAPLRRYDLKDDLPTDITVEGPLRITPTFVLLVEGREVARLEGYPGEDFFWALLGRMLEDHDINEGGKG